TRAKRYAQLLCPDLHPLDQTGPAEDDTVDLQSGTHFQSGAPLQGAALSAGGARGGAGFQPAGKDSPFSALQVRVTTLESEVRSLRTALERLSAALGGPAL